MRMQFIIACGVVLLMLLGTGQAASAATTSPIRSMSVWNAGTDGYLETGSSSSAGYYISTIDIAVPATATAQFAAPLAIPTIINGKQSRVRNIYLRWIAPADCIITNVMVVSGGALIWTSPEYRPGTGDVETVAIDLGSSIACPMGLSVEWSITNTNGFTQKVVEITGYGAKIKY